MYRKFIKSGDVVEVYEYEKINVKGAQIDYDNRAEKGSGEEERSRENYRQTSKKRGEIVRRLINSNFDCDDSKFVTLTFAENDKFDITDVKSCNKEYDKFIKRLKRRYSDVKYVTVIEFQKRGAVHYHMICNLPFVKKKELAELWGLGFVKINKISHVDNVGAYVSKYMSKEVADERLKGLRGYNASKNLERPVELKTWSDGNKVVNEVCDLYIKNKKPVYSAKYTGDKIGQVAYAQYNLKKIKKQQKNKLNEIALSD